MNVPYVMKKCSKCGRWLVANADNFNRTKGGKYGLNSQCKKCKAEYNKKYNEANKEAIAEHHRQHYQENKEAILERQRQYRETHKEAKAEYDRQYRETPSGQVVAFNSNQRRRAKLKSQGNGITKEQWLECMKYFNWECAYSGERLSNKTRSVDHIVPIDVGGDHMIWNMVPMTRSLNCSKKDKDMLEWYKEQDFYSEDRLAKIKEWQEYAFNKWYKEEE